MFSWNGIPLDNDQLGWHLQMGTEPYLAAQRRSSSFAGNGDGNVPVPSIRDASAMPLKVRMLASRLEDFMSWIDAPDPVLSVTGKSKSAAVELLSATPTNLKTKVPEVEVDIVVQFNQPAWRDTSSSTSAPVTLSAATQTVNVMADLSAPVRDAIVRVSGAVSGLRVTDSNGSWFEYEAAVPASSWLRFHSDTGRAFITTSDTWSGGTEVTGAIENGPGPYFLELTPKATNPTDRVATLSVKTTARSSSPQIEVRGRRAYII